jgi:hypothetical protein
MPANSEPKLCKACSGDEGRDIVGSSRVYNTLHGSKLRTRTVMGD